MKMITNFEAVLLENLKTRLDNIYKEDEKFTFFWETRPPFSQWHKCSFVSRPILVSENGLPESFDEAFNFSSAEQFMMLHKALLLNDYERAYDILESKDVREQKRSFEVPDK